MDYPLTVGTFVFEKDDHISVDHQNFPGDEAEWNLIIKRAQPRHSGTYECQISATTVHTYHVHLHVLGKYPNDYFIKDVSVLDSNGFICIELQISILLRNPA